MASSGSGAGGGAISRRPPERFLGIVLTAAGAVGLLGGVIPFVINLARICVHSGFMEQAETADHGLRALGLSSEWALLSSAAGTYLGGLLIAAGAGFLKSKPWAAPVAWAYVWGGLAVNVPDMCIFAFIASAGPARIVMMVLDGAALAFPFAVAAVLIRASRRTGAAGGGCGGRSGESGEVDA